VFPTTFGLDRSIPRVPFNSIDRRLLSIIMMRYQYLFCLQGSPTRAKLLAFLLFISLIFTNNDVLKSNAAFSLLFSRETLTTIIHTCLLTTHCFFFFKRNAIGLNKLMVCFLEFREKSRDRKK